MTTTEHLNAIKAKCHELLTVAEKRTPGRWHQYNGSIINESEKEVVCHLTRGKLMENAAFITSVAGPFEASLRSTIAAISWLEMAHVSAYQPERDEAERVTREILDVWPLKPLLP